MFAQLGLILHRCVHACLKWTQSSQRSKKRGQTGVSLAGILILTDACDAIDMIVVLCIRLRTITSPYFSAAVLLQTMLFSSCQLSVFGRTPWSPPTDYQGNCWPMFLWCQPTAMCAVHHAILETTRTTGFLWRFVRALGTQQNYRWAEAKHEQFWAQKSEAGEISIKYTALSHCKGTKVHHG